MVSAGELVRRHREARGLSQPEVAAALRVSEGLPSQWENGRVAPRRANAMRLDDLLQAGGAILAAYGYARPELNQPQLPLAAHDPAVLRADLDSLTEEVARLSARLEGMGAEVARLRRTRRGGSG